MRYADSLDVHSEPTLVIDANCAAGKQLADQLNRIGFTAEHGAEGGRVNCYEVMN
jgi:hypothetical protein